MQAMVDIADNDDQLKNEIYPIIKDLSETGSGAMRSRGRRLINQLENV
jgi:hypothetical protein